MQSGKPQRKHPHQPVVDQEPLYLTLTLSQSGTSYAGSTVANEQRRRMADEDKHTVESVYSYRNGPDAERLRGQNKGGWVPLGTNEKRSWIAPRSSIP